MNGVWPRHLFRATSKTCCVAGQSPHLRGCPGQSPQSSNSNKEKPPASAGPRPLRSGRSFQSRSLACWPSTLRAWEQTWRREGRKEGRGRGRAGSDAFLGSTRFAAASSLSSPQDHLTAGVTLLSISQRTLAQCENLPKVPQQEKEA